MNPSRGELEAAAMVAEYAANASTFDEEMVAMAQVAKHERVLQLGITAARLMGLGDNAPGRERLPLCDEDGYEFARVVSRIPEDLFWGLYFQKDFGEEGIFEAPIDEINKKYKFCATKTVSGKTVVPVRWQDQRKPERVRFQPGTMEFAK